MKIVIPIHHFPPRYQAGAENYTFGLARWLLRHGHAVHVVCVESIGAAPGSGVSAREDEFAGIPVSRLSIDLAGAPDAFERGIANPAIGEWFAALLERERPDLVHVNSAYLLSVTPIEVTKRYGLPLIVTLHDYWFLCPRIMLVTPAGATCGVPDDAAGCVWCLATERRRFRLPELATRGMLGHLARPLLHSPQVAGALGITPDLTAVTRRRARVWQALAQADRVIATTEFQRQLFLRRGFPAARLQLCPIGLDCAPRAHPPRPSAAAELRIAYVAQVTPHKGLHFLIEAVNRLRVGRRGVRLRVYGDLAAAPGYAQRMRGLAARNPAIELMGAIDNARVGDCLAEADVLVMPAVAPHTGSLAVLEARAAGRPVVVARVGALPELIRDGVDGLTFAAGDVDDLTTVLQRLLDEPALVQQLTSQTRPPRHIDEEMAELLPLYEQLAPAA
jgi:glycosyltransferase involved in cell wall biosynthesis